MRSGWRIRSSESGSALVISILVLFVLSVLGLALMLTTMTEKGIAVNYRWGEQAFYNADAALEYGKNVLAAHALAAGDMRDTLPPPRGAAEMNLPPADAAACGDPTQPGCRDYQYSIQQGGQTIYIGRVLRDLNDRLIQYDFRQPTGNDTRGDIDRDGISDIEGTVTLWVRRPIIGDRDYDKNDRVILTAEGTAPNYEGAAAGRTASLRRLEMTLRVPLTGVSGDQYSDTTKGSDSDGTLGSQAAAAGGVLTTVQ